MAFRRGGSLEDGEELAHGGDQGGLCGPATGPEAEIEVADGRVPADGGDGSHEQHAAHVRTSACDGAVAAHRAGVAVDWRYPDSAARRRRSMFPSSGNSAISVR